VFYDAPSGQARVLGGGFIARTTAMVDHDERLAARPLAASRA
jgi:tRNA-specific 2-thiouridylase